MYAFVGLASAVVGAMTWVSRKKRGVEPYVDIALGPTAEQVLNSQGREIIQDGAAAYSLLTQTLDIPRNPRFINNGTSAAYASELQQVAGTIGIDGSGAIVPRLNPDVLVPTSVENSVIEYVRRCERVVGVDGANPFRDAAFAASCGVCHEGGANSAGQDMVGGLYVSAADKESAEYVARRDGLRTVNYRPSVGSCAPGMFSVSAEGYERIQKRIECAKKQNYSVPGCVQCEGAGFIYVDETDTRAPVSFKVKGKGAFSFTQPRGAVQRFELREGEEQAITPSVPLKEGDVFFMRVEGAGSYVSALLNAPLVTGTYVTDIARLASVDTITGSKPRIGGSSTIGGAQATIFRPASGQSALNLQLDMPYTFLEPNAPSALECPSAPLITLEASAGKLGAGACFARGSAPGNYSLECIRQLWTDAGCTAAGSDYPSDLAAARRLAGARPLGALADDFYARTVESNTGIRASGGARMTIRERDEVAAKCTGKRYGNPCDMYDTGEPLGVDCLEYLYNNTEGASCRPNGGGAPRGADGRENRAVVEALQALGSVDAVKQHYRDVYQRATDNTLSDRDREAAVEQCFGTGFYYDRAPAPSVRSFTSLAANPSAGQKSPYERFSYSYPADVQPVTVLGPYGIAPWGQPSGQGEGRFSDVTALWIWNRAGANVDAPVLNAIDSPAFYYIYEHNGSSPLNARLDFIIDNVADVYVNGEALALNAQGGWAGDWIRNGNRKNIRLLPGTNLIKFTAQNTGGPAGLIAAVFDSTGRLLFHTDESWKTKRAYDMLPVVSIVDLDNHGVYENNSAANLMKENVNDGTQWNPISTATTRGTKTYRLLVKFGEEKNISFARFLTSGDGTHDPTAIRIYRDTSKTDMAGSYGSLAGRQTTDVILHQMSFKTDQLYIELEKTTQYQIWLRRIQFYHNN